MASCIAVRLRIAFVLKRQMALPYEKERQAALYAQSFLHPATEATGLTGAPSKAPWRMAPLAAARTNTVEGALVEMC